MGPTELVGARQWRGAGSSEGQAGERAVVGDAGTGSPSSALSHILLGVVEVVVGGEGEVLSTGPGACVICMLPWALVQQNSCQAGVVHGVCAEQGGGAAWRWVGAAGLAVTLMFYGKSRGPA